MDGNITKKPVLSVVIPTFNRVDKLKKSLDALFEQSLDPKEYEIIIIDDGSDDSTENLIEHTKNTSKVKLKYYPQDHMGPAAARNLGIRMANGGIILFTGDDIIFTKSALEEHLNIHSQYPDQKIGVLGLVNWSSHNDVTPVMKWMEDSGEQFDFRAIENKKEVDPSRFFYTSNLSIKKKIFFETNQFFDEDFFYAAYEDIELGLRLKNKGFILKYNKKALGYHDHYMPIKSYVKTKIIRGKASVRFYNKVSHLTERYKKEPGKTKLFLKKHISPKIISFSKRPFLLKINHLVKVMNHYRWHFLQVIIGIPYYLISFTFPEREFSSKIFRRLSQFGDSLGVLLFNVEKNFKNSS